MGAMTNILRKKYLHWKERNAVGIDLWFIEENPRVHDLDYVKLDLIRQASGEKSKMF